MIATRRAQQLSRLKSAHFDLLIIGGGIVGAGIARDAALRGLAVALVEQGDFASGASSKTSKLIHGGLRYLEHGQFSLVIESLRERHTLQTIAPSLVRPLNLMIPVFSGNLRPAWKIHAGLTLYDLLASHHNGFSYQMLSARQAIGREPNLRAEGLAAAGLYQDCAMDDSRLCLANILQAERFGAACMNYVKLNQWLKQSGQLAGGVVQDCFSGRTFEVRARCVVNASGPWSDHIRQLSDAKAPKRLAPTKGIHLIVPRVAESALFAEAGSDHRMFFILPWGDYSLVGTTESAVKGPLEDLRASADEAGQLIEEVNRILPDSRLTLEDVIATFAGARPLLAFGGSASQASREHRIEVDASGLVSVMGGKYTTFRVMAKQAVDAAIRLKRLRGDRCLTGQISLLEPVHDVLLDQIPELTRLVDPETLSQLIVRYGVGVISILQLLGVEPALSDRICLHHDYLAAEIVYMIRQEMACTITDVLVRRTHMAWSPCQGKDALAKIEDLFERYGGLTPHQVTQQILAFESMLKENLSFRSQPKAKKRILV